jgi:hypothetical protein
VSFLTRSVVALAAVLLWSCQPEIGDSCSNAGDCSVQEQRTCDTTYPGGYCTVLGCAADTCPAEAVCIGYQSVVSIAPECASLQERPRLQRTVCMLSCSRDSDCRGDYACVDMGARNPWGALVVDPGASGKVCALRPPPDPVGEAAVCSPQPVTSTPPVMPPPLVDGGSEGDGGTP